MSCTSAGNIKISPQDVSWEMEETICVDYADAVAADLDAKYFNMYDATVTYYVWANLDAGSTDPAPSGTGIEYAVSTGDSVSVIQAAAKAAIEAATGYAGEDSGTATVFTLDVTDKVLTDAADVDSGFLVQVIHKGGFTDLGLLEGDIETTFEEQLLDITAHQTGTNILTQLRQGNAASISLVLQESTDALYKEVFGAGGGSHTPVAGTELFGWGSSKQGSNTIKQSRRLVFHPRAKDSADHSEDLTFWLAYPNPDSITYSGENPQVLSVSFVTFLDENKPSTISRFAFGDSTQTL